MKKKTVKKVPAKRVKKGKTTKTKAAVQSVELKRILVPIDFSEHSKAALRFAVRYTQTFNASLDLLYVVEPIIYPADFSFGQVGLPYNEDELRLRGDSGLDNLIKTEVPPNIVARRSVRTGKAFYEISQYAKEEQIDIIIIGTHGHTGVEHILFGSTAEKVVRKAPCTVLVYRPESH